MWALFYPSRQLWAPESQPVSPSPPVLSVHDQERLLKQEIQSQGLQIFDRITDVINHPSLTQTFIARRKENEANKEAQEVASFWSAAYKNLQECQDLMVLPQEFPGLLEQLGRLCREQNELINDLLVVEFDYALEQALEADLQERWQAILVEMKNIVEVCQIPRWPFPLYTEVWNKIIILRRNKMRALKGSTEARIGLQESLALHRLHYLTPKEHAQLTKELQPMRDRLAELKWQLYQLQEAGHQSPPPD